MGEEGVREKRTVGRLRIDEGPGSQGSMIT